MTEASLKQQIETIITLYSIPVYERQVKLCEALEKIEKEVLKAVAKWLVNHRHPIYPFDHQEGYIKEEWNMREIARQCQIDELLAELGFSKVTAKG